MNGNEEAEREAAIPPAAMQEAMAPTVPPHYSGMPVVALFQGNPQFFLNTNPNFQSGRHSAPTVPGASPFVAQLRNGANGSPSGSCCCLCYHGGEGFEEDEKEKEEHPRYQKESRCYHERKTEF